MNKRRRNRQKDANPNKVGWRISEWSADVGVSRAYVYILIKNKQIDRVKSGTASIIITPPHEYLSRLARQQGLSAPVAAD